MKYLQFAYFFFLCTSVFGQTTSVVTTLQTPLIESSGLIYLNGQLITHNDSQGEAALFEIDTITGQHSRKVIVENATNVDWEDITSDQNFIYIGDFGNNDGNRTNLKIYRILISDYLTTLNDTVQADEILFSYADQVDFNPGQFATNFDAEGMIAFNDSIYIFTKNWGDYQSNVYQVSNEPGFYVLPKIDSLNVQGLVTGATYDSTSQTLVLCGYQASAFTYSVSGITPPFFSVGNAQKSNLTVQNSFQIEGITSVGNQYYLSAEQNVLGAAALYRFTEVSSLDVSKVNSKKIVELYPNPVVDWLKIDTEIKELQVIVYDMLGQTVLSSKNRTINLSTLKNGTYLINVFDEKAALIDTYKIIKNGK